MAKLLEGQIKSLTGAVVAEDVRAKQRKSSSNPAKEQRISRRQKIETEIEQTRSKSNCCLSALKARRGSKATLRSKRQTWELRQPGCGAGCASVMSRVSAGASSRRDRARQGIARTEIPAPSR